MKISTSLNGPNLAKVIRSTYPDGQPHIKIEFAWASGLWSGDICIQCSIRNPSELFELGMVIDILKARRFKSIHVCIFWLFGARMDRRINDTTPDTFSVVKSMLTSIATKEVTVSILDLHNPKTLGGSAITYFNPSNFINQAINKFGQSDFFLPDKGAAERYKTCLPTEANVLIGGKDRDSATGRISNFRIESGERKCDSVLIIDDICAGGYTFAGQAKVLQGLGYKKIGLYTTHGVYSGDVSILSCFDVIYSTNSFIYEDGDLELRTLKVKSELTPI